eukprot:13423842-Alexandrium_andersonii.AAC.1
MSQDGPRVPVLDDEDRQGRLITVLREEAIVHCDLRNGVFSREITRTRGIRHTPAHTVRTPRPERN